MPGNAWSLLPFAAPASLKAKEAERLRKVAERRAEQDCGCGQRQKRSQAKRSEALASPWKERQRQMAEASKAKAKAKALPGAGRRVACSGCFTSGTHINRHRLHRLDQQWLHDGRQKVSYILVELVDSGCVQSGGLSSDIVEEVEVLQHFISCKM